MGCCLCLLCVRCATKHVCASYESAFIHSDSLRWVLFSPFQYERLPAEEGSEGGGLELRERPSRPSLEEASALLDSMAVALADTAAIAAVSASATATTQMAPQDPAPEVDKDRVLLIRSVSDKQRFRDLQMVEVVKKKTVRRQSRWSRFWQKVGYNMRQSNFWRPLWVFLQKFRSKKRSVSSADDEASGEGAEKISSSDSLPATDLDLADSLFWAGASQAVVQDSLLLAQDSLLTVQGVPTDSLTQEAQADVQTRYRFQYNPKDTFNVDQEFYNHLFGDLFFVKDEEAMSVEESSESAAQDEEIEVPTSYEEYLQQEEAKVLGQEPARGTGESVEEEDKGEEEAVPLQTPTPQEDEEKSEEEEEREVPLPLLEDEGF